jgi:hypothetical protein
VGHKIILAIIKCLLHSIETRFNVVALNAFSFDITTFQTLVIGPFIIQVLLARPINLSYGKIGVSGKANKR